MWWVAEYRGQLFQQQQHTNSLLTRAVMELATL